MSERRYTEEEAQEILSRALEKQGLDASKTSHDDLRRAAEEVGIPGAELDAAAAELATSACAWRARRAVDRSVACRTASRSTTTTRTKRENALENE